MWPMTNHRCACLEGNKKDQLIPGRTLGGASAIRSPEYLPLPLEEGHLVDWDGLPPSPLPLNQARQLVEVDAFRDRHDCRRRVRSYNSFIVSVQQGHPFVGKT